MFYNARYYMPELRRFISADTIVPGPSNPLAYNRYAYVFNNPIMYTDPSGHVPCIDGLICTNPNDYEGEAIKDYTSPSKEEDDFFTPDEEMDVDAWVTECGGAYADGFIDEYCDHAEIAIQKLYDAGHILPHYLSAEEVYQLYAAEFAEHTKPWDFQSIEVPIIDSVFGPGISFTTTIDRYGNVYHSVGASMGIGLGSWSLGYADSAVNYSEDSLVYIMPEPVLQEQLTGYSYDVTQLYTGMLPGGLGYSHNIESGGPIPSPGFTNPILTPDSDEKLIGLWGIDLVSWGYSYTWITFDK